MADVLKIILVSVKSFLKTRRSFLELQEAFGQEVGKRS